MFVELAKLMENCDLNITLSLKEGKLHAIVLPKPKENNKLDIAPMSLCGTPEEYETEFLNAVAATVPKVEGFVSDMTAMEEGIKKAKEEKAEKATKKESAPKKESTGKAEKVETPAVVKVNAADEFKKGLELLNNAKYKEAEPFLQAACDAKPDNKTYQEKLKLCKSWILRLSENNLFVEETVVETPGAVNVVEETPFVEEPATTVEAIDEKHEATVNEQPEEDEFQFSLD